MARLLKALCDGLAQPAREPSRLLIAEEKRRQSPTYKQYVREHHLQKNYGITVAQKEQLFRDQKGCCAACNDSFETTKSTHVDHIHETKIIRGLLCRNCNIALGLVNDEIKRLHALISYLERSLERSPNGAAPRKLPKKT